MKKMADPTGKRGQFTSARAVTDAELKLLGEQAFDADNEPMFQIINELVQRRQRPASGEMMVTTIVSHRDRRPIVRHQVGEVDVQMSPDDARHHAQIFLEAANAAEMDAFMVNFFTDELGMSIDKAHTVLVAFRAYREKYKQEKAKS